MKAVMLSLRPQWCEKIFNGSKSIEVRKSRPSIPTPFKVYVYQTKHKGGNATVREVLNSVYSGGKVIGSFVCDRIVDIKSSGDDCGNYWHEWSDECDIEDMCLSYEELETYLGKSVGYGWHISDLKIYDKPKELREFRKPNFFRDCENNCRINNTMEYWRCPIRDSHKVSLLAEWCRRKGKPLTRPPQSYYFVEINEN